METTNSTLARLLTLAASTFKRAPSELDPNADMFETLGIDSVDAMALLTALETEFKVEIPDYEVQDVRTFSGLAKVIEERC